MRAILDATYLVLIEVGSKLTRDKVAKAAGIPLKTLAEHFPDRVALLECALAEHIEVAVRAIEAATIEARARDLPALAAARVRRPCVLRRRGRALRDRVRARPCVRHR